MFLLLDTTLLLNELETDGGVERNTTFLIDTEQTFTTYVDNLPDFLTQVFGGINKHNMHDGVHVGGSTLSKGRLNERSTDYLRNSMGLTSVVSLELPAPFFLTQCARAKGFLFCMCLRATAR